MSLLGDLWNSLPTPGQLTNSQAAMRAMAAGLQAKVGVFLQQKQRLLGIQGRASSLSRLNNTSQQGAVLLSRSKALLDQQDAIEGDAVKQMAAANSLKTSFETDPFWQQVLASNWSVLGTSTLGKVRDMIARLTSTTSAINDCSTRIDHHVSDVNGLEKDVVDAESYASGKGIKAFVEEAAGSGASFYQGLLGKPLMIFAGIAAAILVAPIALDTGASLMAKRRASSNPRRARRRSRR